MQTDNVDAITDKVIGCAYHIHNELGQGFLEKVYENALKIELTRAGLDVKQQHPAPVTYEGELVGDFYADLMIADSLIVELKAVRRLSKADEAQLVNYLAATGIDDGLLINFGTSLEVKRKFRKYTKTNDDTAQ